MKEKKTGGFFYGWVIVFACMLLAAASTGLLSYFGALFVTPVSASLGIARAPLMVYSTIATVTAMLLMPFTGALFKRFPLKLLLVLGALLAAGSQFCFSLSGSVYGFYIGAVMSGTGTCLFGAIPMALLISNWFRQKQGVATGLAFAGTGLVTATLSPAISRIITEWGWRWGYRVIGAAILITALAAILLIRKSPADMGLEPLGAHAYPAAEKTNEPSGFTRKQIFAMPAFWIFALAIFLVGALTMGTQQQLIAYWVDEGNSPEFAARMYALVMFVGIFAKILLGGLYDKTGVKPATVISCLTASGALICFALIPKGPGVAFPAVLFGIATSIQVLAATYITGALFGTREYASTYGLITTVLYLGAAVGGLVSAGIYDAAGSYKPGWIAFALLFAAAMLAITTADTLSKKANNKPFKTTRNK